MTKEVHINTTLNFVVQDEAKVSISNIIIITNRMRHEAEDAIQTQSSRDLIRDLDAILKSYQQLKKLVDKVGEARDEATEHHNSLYGKLKKK